MPPRLQPRVTGFNSVGNLCIEWVDVIRVLYNTGTVEKDDMQRTLRTENG